MLELIAVTLVLLWVLGLAMSTTINGFIHILLVSAAGVILAHIMNRKKFDNFGIMSS